MRRPIDGVAIPFAAFEFTDEPRFAIDAGGKILAANRAARREFPDASDGDFFTPFEDAALLRRAFEAGRTDGAGRRIAARVADRDVEFVFHVHDAGALVAIDNVEERKRLERELVAFRSVAEKTVNPVQIVNTDGEMVFVNDAFERASGYAKEELLGKNPRVSGSGEHSEDFWRKMWEKITNGRTWIGEVANRRKSGELAYSKLVVSPIADESGETLGYFGVHRDVTENRLIERRLIQTQKMENIGALAAGVAHEVGNPLASISALVQILKRSIDDEFAQEKLDLVKSQIQRISRIIRELVDLSRPTGEEPTPTDLHKQLDEAIEIVRVGKKSRQVNFERRFDPNLEPIVGVADRIQQVFVNILINAADAVAEKLERVRDGFEGEIVVETEARNGEAIVRFRDNGVGVDADKLEKIFEPFYTTKGERRGTGLGLWVSDGMIRSLGGSLGARSEPGEWTEFELRLPERPE